MRVGLYGGSFDPAHAGHAHVAAVAMRRLGLDRVIWLVSPGNPLKPGAGASLSRRMAQARRIAGRSIWVSDAERRLATRFTIDTLRALKRRFPAVRFVWIMGGDGLANLHRWRNWAALMRLVPVAVVARPGYVRAALGGPAARRFRGAQRSPAVARGLAGLAPPAWIYLAAPFNPLSSTHLRAAASRDRLARARMPS